MNDKTIKMRDRLDELSSAIAPSKVVLDIHDWENKHSQKTIQDYQRFIAQFELYYETAVELCHVINYIDKKNWPAYRSVQFLLIVHNLKSLYSSFDKLVKGFYEDSIILARPPYEGFIKCIYITCNPSDPYSVITNSKDASGKKFNLTNFLKEELKLDWIKYQVFSALVHANQYSVLKDTVEIQQAGQKDAISLKFIFDKTKLETGINDVSYILLVFLKMICEFFATSANDIHAEALLERGRELIMLREEGLLLNTKDYWPRVVLDTRDIFQMMKRAESESEGWENIWKEIRHPN